MNDMIKMLMEKESFRFKRNEKCKKCKSKEYITFFKTTSPYHVYFKCSKCKDEVEKLLFRPIQR